MKRIKKKRVIILLIVLAVGIIIAIPISKYIHTLKLYYRFQSSINVEKDTIFKEKKMQHSYFPDEFNETSRLFYLCKVWGYLKYYHENIDKTSVDVDKILLTFIPASLQIDNKLEFGRILDSMIVRFQTSPVKGNNPYPNIDDYILIDNDWMNDTICLNHNLKDKLNAVFMEHTGRRNPYIFNKGMIGNLRMTEKNYSNFPNENYRLLGLFRYWNVINYFYVYKNHIDEHWDKVLYDMIPVFRKAETKVDYHKGIYRLTNRLRDTHASYPPTIDGTVFGAYRPNFKLLLIDSTFVINTIRVPELEKEDFCVGDIVLAIDNQDIHYLADSLNQYVCGGNYWSNQSFVCNAVLSRYDSITSFKILRGKDTLTIKSKNYNVRKLFNAKLKKEKEAEKTKLYRWVNDTIAYWDLCSATKQNFKRNYNPIKNAAVIILDLRNYPSTDLIFPLTNTFVPPNSFFAYVTYPDSRFPGLVKYIKSTSDPIGDSGYYRGQVIVLVNEWTESYSEYTTMALQANPKTITVGNNSSGADGNITIFEFPGGVQSLYSGIGIYYPDFTPTQRVGIQVDYIAEPTIVSITNNIDVAYEKAVELAKQGNITKSKR